MPRPAGMGLTMSEMDAVFRARADEAVTVGRCTFCPELSWEGTAAEVREAGRQHLLDVHPEVTRKRRPRRPPNPSRFVQNRLTDDEEREVQAEVARRARLHGLELSGSTEI